MVVVAPFCLDDEGISQGTMGIMGRDLQNGWRIQGLADSQMRTQNLSLLVAYVRWLVVGEATLR